MSKFSFLMFICLLLTSCGGGGSDSGGNSGGSNPPANKIPTVSAGNDQTVDEQTTVTLTGTAADSDGSVSSYSWTQTAGTTVTLSNDTSASATFTAPDINADETLTFKLTVTDNDGANANDSVSIIVKRVNELPTVNAGNDQTVNEQTAVTLTGTASDSDGSVSSYSWTQTEGTTVTLNNANTVTASFTAPDINSDETLIFQLTISDNDGATAIASTNINVIRVNQAPIADTGGDQTVNEQTEVSLIGAGYDPDGTIVSYNWTQISGASVVINDQNSASTSFTAPITETKVELSFQLTVTDEDGGISNASVVIIVNPTLNVNIEQSTVDIASVSSGTFGEVELVDGVISIDPKTISEEGFVTAYDAEDNIIWLGYVKEGDETVELNGRSTARVLILLVPNIAIFQSSNPEIFEGYLNDSQEISNLISYLSKNQDWYQLPQIFSDLYSAAVMSIFNRINIDDLSLATKRSGNSGVKKAVVVVATDNNGELTTNYTQTLNGIEIKVNSIVDEGNIDRFSIDVTNKLNRWVGITIGADPETYKGLPNPIDSQTPSYIYKGKDDSARFEDQLSKLVANQSDQTYGVYIFSPAIDDFFGDYDQDLFATNLHQNAAAYTLLFDIAVPVFGKAIGGESCLRQMFDPTRQAYDIASTIIGDQDIQSYIYQKNLDKAALQIGNIIADSIANTGSECLKAIAIKQLQKLIPLIGQVQTISDVFGTIKTVNDVYQTVSTAKSKTTWEVKNSINMSFSMEGVEDIRSNGYGWLTYIKSDKIPNEFSTRYQGTCDNNIPKTACGGYMFAPDTPKVIRYHLRCIDPVSQEFTLCDLGVVEPEMLEYLPNENGDIVIDLDYSDTGDKEYTHTFKVYDTSSAMNQYTASVQIKEATPQLVLKVDGKEIPASINASGDLVNNTPYLFDSTSRQPETVSFELFNKGLASAKINSTSISGSNSFVFNNLTPDTTVSILPNESKTFDVTHTPNGNQAEEAQFIITGNLGKTNVNSNLLGFNSYIRMDLNVNSLNVCENASPPEILNVAVSCSETSIAQRIIDVTYQDPLGVISGGGGGSFTGDNYPTRLWFNPENSGEFGFAANGYTASLLEGDIYSGTVRIKVFSPVGTPSCTKDSNYKFGYRWHKSWKVGLLNQCGIESETTPFELHYWDLYTPRGEPID
ncbi:PKD domain-containing protein [Flavobacterium sp. W21_SRS_FM6]|uniref:PKD domain-containing protein n=1 Tax=Flavobacterium sp. W21_SRS_FM6 TaxID=3240268 RepID=UPI003F90D513